MISNSQEMRDFVHLQSLASSARLICVVETDEKGLYLEILAKGRQNHHTKMVKQVEIRRPQAKYGARYF